MGAGSFDNIGDAIILVFTSVTLEGWVDVMYALYHSFGASWLVSAYFILLVVFGSFFVMNLAMAVIWDEYQAADEKNNARMALEAEVKRPKMLVMPLRPRRIEKQPGNQNQMWQWKLRRMERNPKRSGLTIPW